MKTVSKPMGYRLVGLGFLLALALALPQTALAHAKLTRSSPADKASLTNAPQQIELWFSELLDDKFNSIEVVASKDVNAKPRVNLAQGEPKVDPKDRTHLTIELKALEPGEYTVDWRVLSRDGHSAPGRFTFRVLAPVKK